jgi:hypothetical protein
VSAVAAVKALLRIFSYVFHALLALFLIAVAVLSLLSGTSDLQMRMLPFTGTTLVYVLLFAPLFGLITILLAIKGKLRVLFFLWTLVVLGFLLRGYVFSPYRFRLGEFTTVVYLVSGALISVLGAWFQVRRGPSRKKF